MWLPKLDNKYIIVKFIIICKKKTEIHLTKDKHNISWNLCQQSFIFQDMTLDSETRKHRVHFIYGISSLSSYVIFYQTKQ